MAETPSAAAVVWNSRPVHRPHAVAMPAPLPEEILCVSTKMISGPGSSVRAAEAAMKYSSCAGSVRVHTSV